MAQPSNRMRGVVWLFPAAGGSAWHFVTLPKAPSDLIKKNTGPHRGWGAVKVQVTIGKTSWKTSIFPYAKENAYILPLKADVRKKEKIQEGDTITFKIELE